MLIDAITGGSITAKVPYLRADLDCLEIRYSARNLSAEVLDRRELEIRNGRSDGQTPSLEREGFELVNHRCRVVEDYLDDLLERGTPPGGSPLQHAYQNEMIPLIRQLSGAREVLPALDSIIRYSGAAGNKEAMTPAGWAHFDYDAPETLVQLEQTLELNDHDPAPFSRYVLYQGWRVLSLPPQDFPLAMCDGRTVKADDVIPIEYHMDRTEREITYKSSGARFSPLHEWWYYPDMARDEILVFKGFDSALGDTFKTLHVAVEDCTRPNPIPRVSIESRYFALFD